MRKFISVTLTVLMFVFLTVMLVLGLAFTFIEGRLIFAGDFIVYDNAFNGFMRYFLRLLLALLAVSVAIIEYINLAKKCKKLSELTFCLELGLFVASIFILAFATNYAGLACIGVSGLVFILKLIITLINSKQKKTD